MEFIPIMVAASCAIVLTLVFFAVFDTGEEDSEKTQVDYETASHEVFKRYYHYFSAVYESAESTEAKVKKMEGDLEKSKSIQCANTRRAYAYWIPHFIKEGKRRRVEFERSERYSREKHKVPKLPSTSAT